MISFHISTLWLYCRNDYKESITIEFNVNKFC